MDAAAAEASIDAVCTQARSHLVALIHSGALSQAVRVAAELRIAELLTDGPRHVAELAQATETDPSSLHRLLRALASLGFCVEMDDGSFALAAMGSLLRADAPDLLRSWVLWSCSYQWPVWENLLHSVKTGESARNRMSGTDGFGHLVRDPEAAVVFNDAMVEVTRLIAREVTRNYDFGEARQIVDVGGGFGALLVAILHANPGVHGVLFDLPHAIEGARTQFAQSNWRSAATSWPAISSSRFRAVRMSICSRASSTTGTTSAAPSFSPTVAARSPRMARFCSSSGSCRSAWTHRRTIAQPPGRTSPCSSGRAAGNAPSGNSTRSSKPRD